MSTRPLPSELQRFDGLPDLVYRGSNEWSAACPHCGGADGSRRSKSDRFRLFAASNGTNARAWCRRCGHFEWADQDEAQPDPIRIAQARELQAEYARKEAERISAKIAGLQEAAYWRGWHDAMSKQQRELWHREGIIDFFVDYYSLGYNPDYTYNYDGRQYHSPSLTIPHYGDGWELVNVQHRLLEPASGAGKYRQMAGLPAAMFRTEPDEALTGGVLIVEGAKKAIVSYLHLGTEPIGFPMLILGVPSKTPGAAMLEQLANCEPVYLALDPDAYEDSTARRFGEKLGSERVRYVQFPDKPDDLITKYGLKADDLRKYLRRATVTV